MNIKKQNNVTKVFNKVEKNAVIITDYGYKIIVEYRSVWRCHYEKFRTMRGAWYDAYRIYREELK